ncbi:Glucose-repressible alcohol dehydrogenase transcriptional effector [Apophysomyces sp. BC1021]|nr:Glucose-repressible alcohol dehydrogenase transcriptional effector [Apophysomyces sp. BC1021]
MVKDSITQGNVLLDQTLQMTTTMDKDNEGLEPTTAVLNLNGYNHEYPSLDSGAESPHWVQQMSRAQLARQAGSPHHHARTAAVTARTQHTEPKHKSSNKKKPTAEAETDVGWSSLDLGGIGLLQVSHSLFSTYQFLTALYLNHNQLTRLDPAVRNLTYLVTLDLSCNQIEDLPPDVGMLTNLRELLLFDNLLEVLPPELGSLYQLDLLGIDGNPLEEGLKLMLANEVGLPPPEREWLLFNSDPNTDAGENFTVFSYNVLCQKYASTFGYTPSWALAWEYRCTLTLDWEAFFFYIVEVEHLKVNSHRQEVELGEYEDCFSKRLEQDGYRGVFWPKSRAKTMMETERRSVDGFRLLDKTIVEYNQVAMRRSDLKTRDMYNRLMNKDNVAIIALLEHRERRTPVVVANSHIHWDPTCADVKLIQVSLLTHEITSFMQRHGVEDTAAVILCGDFNSEPESSVYELLSRGQIAKSHPDLLRFSYGTFTAEGLQQPLRLESAYSQIGELPFTNYTPHFKGVLDYIWYSTTKLGVTGLLGSIEEEFMAKVVGLPDPHFPSDHIPIMAEFSYAYKKAKLEEHRYNGSSF